MSTAISMFARGGAWSWLFFVAILTLSRSSAAEQQDRLVALAGPSLADWYDGPERQLSPPAGRVAAALHYRTDIYRYANTKVVIGYFRRGRRIAVDSRRRGKACSRGAWYRLGTGGYVCSTRGVRIGADVEVKLYHRLPRINRPLPYSYYEMKQQGTPLLFRLPSAEERQQIALAAGGKAQWPDVVDKSMKGYYVLAIAQRVVHDGQAYYRTVYGRYLRAGAAEPFAASPMHGVHLNGRSRRLPIAFVWRPRASVYRHRRGALKSVGSAVRHARFMVRGALTFAGTPYLLDRTGRAIARDALRLASAVARPHGVGRAEKWIHVDLKEQTLVAYRGDQPVFATLISSGKKGYAPPPGEWRIRAKHVTVTMNGSDPIDGWYEVEEVPWTMYYHGGFALHGAYWHNDFGTARSHGCTNLAPADARWLFFWTDPKMPRGWHGRIKSGTLVKVTS